MAQEMRNSVPLWTGQCRVGAVEAWLTCGGSHVFKVASCFPRGPWWPQNVMSSNDQATRKSGSSLSASLLETRRPFPSGPHMRGVSWGAGPGLPEKGKRKDLCKMRGC